MHHKLYSWMCECVCVCEWLYVSVSTQDWLVCMYLDLENDVCILMYSVSTQVVIERFINVGYFLLLLLLFDYE